MVVDGSTPLGALIASLGGHSHASCAAIDDTISSTVDGNYCTNMREKKIKNQWVWRMWDSAWKMRLNSNCFGDNQFMLQSKYLIFFFLVVW